MSLPKLSRSCKACLQPLKLCFSTMSTQPNSLRNSESEFLRHTPCPTCGSSDANSVYSDGHSFCFACNTYTHPDSSVRSMSVSAVSLEGYAQRLNKRKISESTCQRYNIRRDGDRLRFYYYSADGRVVGCKTKTKDKNFSYEGQTEGTFFGQHLWPSQGKMVVITEGELDVQASIKFSGRGPLFLYPTDQPQPRRVSKRILNGCRGTRRSSYFSTTMKQDAMRRKRLRRFYHPARYSSASLTNTRMPVMRYRRMILQLLRELSGMQSLTDLMASSMASLYWSL